MAKCKGHLDECYIPAVGYSMQHGDSLATEFKAILTLGDIMPGLVGAPANAITDPTGGAAITDPTGGAYITES